MNRKLGALETLRGLGALVVLLLHVSLAFIPSAYDGLAAKARFDWEELFHTSPLGILIAGGFAVDVFFVLSGFVLALSFLGPDGKGDDALASAIVRRPLRLAPIVAVGVLLPAVFHWLGWMAPKEAASITGSDIFLALQGGWNASLITLVKLIGFNLFSQGQQFNCVLWTIEVELLGSFFVYLVLFVLRKSTWRWAVYAVLAVWFRNDLMLAFLSGLVLADAYAESATFRQWSGRWPVFLLAAGLALWLGSYPKGLILMGQSPAGLYRLLPACRLGKDGWQFVGAVLLIAACVGSKPALLALDSRPGRFLGRISFALYVVHVPVLCSVGCRTFLWLHGAGATYAQSAGWAAIASIAVAILTARLLTWAVDEPSVRFAAWAGARFSSSLRSFPATQPPRQRSRTDVSETMRHSQ